MTDAKRVKLDIDPQEDEEESSTGKFVIPDEKEIGIEEYVSPHEGFSGLVKQRYSDFIVHEVTEDDEIVQLTSMELPEEPGTPDQGDKDRGFHCEILAKVANSSNMEMLEKLSDGDETIKNVDLDVSDMDKEDRKKIHKSISVLFPGLYTSTKEVDGKKILSISRTNAFRGKSWPYSDNFTHFVAYQENRGTFGVVNALSELLHLNPKGISYAGTKDKRAISCQRMAVKKLHPHRLVKINQILSKAANPVAVGNISFKASPLRLGQSHGNHFKMVIRDVCGESSEIEAAFTNVKEKGFINYFGTQRFGSGTVRTDRVGRHIFRKDWKLAIESILSCKIRDMRSPWGPEKSFNRLLAKWKETRDAAGIYKDFFWKNMVEGIILRELSKNKENYRNALLAIPRNNRHLYVHAYQSWIWNKVVSERIRDHGMKVLVGDLLLTHESNTEEPEGTLENSLMEYESNVSSVGKNEPIFVTDAYLTTASIYDVVIPLPGYRIKFPQNETGDKMKTLLEQDGVDLISSDNGFSLYGTYRRIIVKPKRLSFDISEYRDERVRLFATDLDKLRDQTSPVDDLSICPHEERKKAVKLEFSLPASSYATICVREIMKRNVFS